MGFGVHGTSQLTGSPTSKLDRFLVEKALRTPLVLDVVWFPESGSGCWIESLDGYMATLRNRT